MTPTNGEKRIKKNIYAHKNPTFSQSKKDFSRISERKKMTESREKKKKKFV